VDSVDNSALGHIVVKKRIKREMQSSRARGGTSMTTIQAVIFGIMLALTPSMVLVAILLSRTGNGLGEADIDLEFEDQPPYPQRPIARLIGEGGPTHQRSTVNPPATLYDLHSSRAHLTASL
jgi:hypothetical protein